MEIVRYSETQSYSGYGGSNNRRNSAPPKPSQWYAGQEYTWDETLQDYVRWVNKGQSSFPIKLSDEMAKHSGQRHVREMTASNRRFRRRWNPDETDALVHDLAQYTSSALAEALKRADALNQSLNETPEAYRVLKERARQLSYAMNIGGVPLKPAIDAVRNGLWKMYFDYGDETYRIAANELDTNLQQLDEEIKQSKSDSAAQAIEDRERSYEKEDYQISVLEKDLKGLRRMHSIYGSDDLKDAADELENQIKQLKQKLADDRSGETRRREYRKHKLGNITFDIRRYNDLLKELDEQEQKRKDSAPNFLKTASEEIEKLENVQKEIDKFYQDNGYDRNKSVYRNLVEIQTQAAHECERLNSRIEGLEGFLSVKKYADDNKDDEQAQEDVRNFAAFLEVNPNISLDAIQSECDALRKQIDDNIERGKEAEEIANEFVEKSLKFQRTLQKSRERLTGKSFTSSTVKLTNFTVTPQWVEDLIQNWRKQQTEYQNEKWSDIDGKRERYVTKLENLEKQHDVLFDRLSPEEKQNEKQKQRAYDLNSEKSFYEGVLDKTDTAYHERAKQINDFESGLFKLVNKLESYEKQAKIVADCQRQFGVTSESYANLDDLKKELDSSQTELSNAKEARRALKRTHIKNFSGFEVNLPVSLDELPRSLPPDDRLKKIFASKNSRVQNLDELRNVYQALIQYRDDCRKKARDSKIDRLEERVEKFELRQRRLEKQIRNYEQEVSAKLVDIEPPNLEQLANKYPSLTELFQNVDNDATRYRLPLDSDPYDEVATLRESLEQKIKYLENNPNRFTLDDIAKDREAARKKLMEINTELNKPEDVVLREEAERQADATAKEKLDTLRQSPTYHEVQNDQKLLMEQQRKIIDADLVHTDSTTLCPANAVSGYFKTGYVAESQKNDVSQMLASAGLSFNGQDTQLLKKMRSNDDFRKKIGRYIAGVNLILSQPSLRCLVSNSDELFANYTDSEYFSEDDLRRRFAYHVKKDVGRLRNRIKKSRARKAIVTQKLEEIEKALVQDKENVRLITGESIADGDIHKFFRQHEAKIKEFEKTCPTEQTRKFTESISALRDDLDDISSFKRELRDLDTSVKQHEVNLERLEKTWAPEQAEKLITLLHNLSKKEMREWCDVGIRYDEEHKCFTRSRLYNTSNPELSRCDVSVVSYALAKSFEDPHNEYDKPKRYGAPAEVYKGTLLQHSIADEIKPLSILEPGSHGEQELVTSPIRPLASINGYRRAVNRCSQAMADSSDGLISFSPGVASLRLNSDTSSVDILTQILDKN